jgi:hypothetical protein
LRDIDGLQPGRVEHVRRRASDRVAAVDLTAAIVCRDGGGQFDHARAPTMVSYVSINNTSGRCASREMLERTEPMS